MAESKRSMLLQRIVGIIISRPNKFSNNSSKNNNNNSCNNNNSSSYNNNDNNCNNSSSRSIWRHSLKPKDSNRSLRFYFFRNLAAEIILTNIQKNFWSEQKKIEKGENRLSERNDLQTGKNDFCFVFSIFLQVRNFSPEFNCPKKRNSGIALESSNRLLASDGWRWPQ